MALLGRAARLPGVRSSARDAGAILKFIPPLLCRRGWPADW
jgi:hypothetical protein